jgi:hypothetical protein
MYINDAIQTHGVHLTAFAGDTRLCAADRKEGFVVRKLQCDLSSMEIWYGHWNIRINEDKTRVSIFLSAFVPCVSFYIE